MASSWQIDDRCPRCGAAVTLDETDRLLSCAYCQVRLYVAADGAPRYCLPVKPAPVGEIVMVPYWRVRAQHYRCVPWELRSGLLDLTQLAAPAPGLPASLGVRAQAVRLRFAAEDAASRFLPASRPLPEPGRHLRAALAAFGDEPSLFETSVGTAASIVYTPVRLTRAVFDAVLNRRLAPDAAQWLAASDPGTNAPPPIRFLATLCPSCGWQLEAARDSLVLLCVNCRRAFRANHAGLGEFPYSVLDAGERGGGGGGYRQAATSTFDPRSRYLPFWQVAARIPALGLESWADLARFANLPVVVRAEWRSAPAVFWIPAFGLHPDQFLRAAQAVTLARPGAAVGEVRPGRDATGADERSAPPLRTSHAVTIAEDTLASAVLVLAASLGHPKTRVFPRLREAAVEADTPRLVYVPVDFDGREYRNPSLHLVVQGTALEWGAGR